MLVNVYGYVISVLRIAFRNAYATCAYAYGCQRAAERITRRQRRIKILFVWFERPQCGHAGPGKSCN